MIDIPNSLHFVIDIETLGVKEGCPIFQIGATAQSLFDMVNDKEEVFHTFYTRPSIKSCLEYGLTNIDEITLEWWASQPNFLFAKQLHDYGESDRGFDDNCEHRVCYSHDLKVCLTQLAEFTNDISNQYIGIGERSVRYENIYYWCRGTDFDFPILRDAYRKVLNDSSPFAYYKCRDIRTIDNPIFGYAVTEKPTVIHNALDDAIQELKTLREVMRYQYAGVLMQNIAEKNEGIQFSPDDIPYAYTGD